MTKSTSSVTLPLLEEFSHDFTTSDLRGVVGVSACLAMEWIMILGTVFEPGAISKALLQPRPLELISLSSG